jgi:nucleotide-binding universal stress UspA family protein
VTNAISEGISSRRVVVGVDSSLSSRVALEHAAQRVGPSGSLLVTHVISPVTDAISSAVSELDDERHAVARALVDRLAADVAVEADPVVLNGFAPERLAALADERRAHEIVVGSRGLGRFAAALGSVSHALLEHARHPVVVVPQAAADHPRQLHEHGTCTVVLGYDGSEPARAALTYATQRAASGGRVVAVHAFQPAPDWLGSPYYQRALDAHQAEGRELKAFNTTFAGTLVEGQVAGQPLDVFLASDDGEAKAIVSKLVEDGGLRPVDAGPLGRARELEAAGLLHMSVQDALGTGFGSSLKILNE